MNDFSWRNNHKSAEFPRLERNSSVLLGDEAFKVARRSNAVNEIVDKGADERGVDQDLRVGGNP